MTLGSKTGRKVTLVPSKMSAWQVKTQEHLLSLFYINMSMKHQSRNILNVIHDRTLSEKVTSRRILRDRVSNTKNLFFKDLKEHFGCVNAIEFSNQGGELIASGMSSHLFISIHIFWPFIDFFSSHFILFININR